MGKIGLFGGTFDPPHKGHIKLASAVLDEFSLDKLLFIPAGNPPHKKDKKKTDKIHRYEMVKIAIEGQSENRFSLSDFDIKNEEPNYSYLTIAHFKDLYPDDEIFFIVGADSYRDFPLWKNYPDILSLCTFIVVNRQGIENDSYYEKYKKIDASHKALFLKDFSYDLSSTELREQILSGNANSEDLPDGVWDYIIKNKLYSRVTADIRTTP